MEKTSHCYSKKHIIDLEQRILQSLNFQLTAPNRFTFINLVINHNKYLEEYDGHSRSQVQTQLLLITQKRYIDFLYFLSELTLLNNWKENYSEKEIADATVYLTDKVMKRP